MWLDGPFPAIDGSFASASPLSATGETGFSLSQPRLKKSIHVKQFSFEVENFNPE